MTSWHFKSFDVSELPVRIFVTKSKLGNSPFNNSRLFTSLSRGLSCLWSLGEGWGEKGGTGEVHREEGPKDDKEDPLGCRLLLLKIKKSLLQPFLYHLNEKNTKNLNIKCRIYGYIFPTGSSFYKLGVKK